MPTRAERVADLRRRVEEARSLIAEAQLNVLWVRTGPEPDDEEPTAVQRQIWATCNDLERAIALVLPENDPWYAGPECADFTRVLEALERLGQGHPS